MTMNLPVAAVAIVAALAMGFAVPSTKPIVNPAVENAGSEAGEDAAGASILGKFRTSLAATIDQKTDLYVHNGTELRPLSQQELKAGQTGVGIAKGEKAVNGTEDNLVTTIPSPERDFRGIFGDLERATGPYRNMKGHTHNGLDSTIPLFRLMTWIDPQYLHGWTTGAFVMNDGAPAGYLASMRFLKEGLRNNPSSVSLLTEIGSLTASRDPRDKGLIRAAIPWFEKARSTGYPIRNTIADEERSGLENAYRSLAICYGVTSDMAALRKSVEEGLGVFPDDQVLLRYAIKLGMPVNIPKS